MSDQVPSYDRELLLGGGKRNALLELWEVYETVLPAWMAELRARFDWSMLRIYGLNTPGQNHGLLLGTGRWMP